MVLGQAVADAALPANPADYVKLPIEHNQGTTRLLDDPAQILTAAQVSTLVAATPWPYTNLVLVAALGELRAAELAGLQVGDVILPPVGRGKLRVERAIAGVGAELVYIPVKTQASRRQVELSAQTTTILRDYFAVHPRRDHPAAPLFAGMALRSPRPTGVRVKSEQGVTPATRQAQALAELSLAEAGERLLLDWDSPLRHATFYKAVFRPAILRANRLTPAAAISPALKFHSLRHSHASHCIAVGMPVEKLSRRLGHAKIGTTLGIYVHLLPDDDAAADMAALDALGAAPDYGPNVVPLRKG